MERLNPEWAPLVRLIGDALDAGREPVWARAEVRLRPDRLAGAPLLDGATITLDARAAARSAGRLLHLATRTGTPAGTADLPRTADLRRTADPPRGVDDSVAGHTVPGTKPLRLPRRDLLALLEAAVAVDTSRIHAVATSAGTDPDALAAAAQIAALPLLQAIGVRLRDDLPEDTDARGCPICGAWPALAESRGLERARRLRCGRCACDWPATPLRCVFCGERDHHRLTALVPEGQEESLRAETCATCSGYLKTITTLDALEAAEITAEDLRTVELDLAAIQEGFARPDLPAWSPRLHLIGQGGRFPWFGRA